jgi:hypothetical protein
VAVAGPDAAPIDITVPNVTPGVYHVQTVLEFAE